MTRYTWHALAGCTTCGTRWQGILCDECKQTIIIDESYNEFEIRNRGRKYVAVANHWYTFIMIIVPILATVAYLDSETRYFWLVLLVTDGIFLAILKRKRTIKNPFYSEEDRSWQTKANV